ncbi:MAG TPA: DUF4199 domain-containing protein [Rhizomicrobium sp.]|nr:DUF4199 domain-containing protein [Rhizomicrobium sp.]
MLRKILTYGTVAGLLVGIPLSAITVTMHGHSQQYGMLIGYTTMLIALSTVFVAIKRHRDVELGGVIGFWQALRLGLGISVVAGIFYVAAWEITVAATGLDFASTYAAAVIAEKKAAGVSGAALAKVVADMDAFKVQYANPLYRWPMTFAEIFPVGVLVSLVSAGLLRNSRFLPLRRA